MSNQRARVSAIVVSYNVSGLLRQCLRSLQSCEVDEIVVIDSSSTDDSADMVRRDFPDAILQIVPNRGYGAGANAGIELATGDALLILNADTSVKPEAVGTLVDTLYSVDDLGMVGPRLVHPDGSTQSSRRRFPTRWTPVFESTILEEWFPRNRWVRDYRNVCLDQRPPGNFECVDWFVGAALMVRRAVIEQAGGFCEAFFLYGEELEWCYRIRQHGWDIGYVDRAIVTHHEAASTSQDQLGSRLEFDRGRVRAHKALHGTAAARRTARFLRINYAAMLLRESAKWAIGHRRDLRAARISAYRELMRSDLNG